MKKNYFIFCLLVLMFVLHACTVDTPTTQTAVPVSPHDSALAAARKDSLEACAPVIKDPNKPKPMALMMRLLAAHADSMRSQLLRGEHLEATRYPFVHFYLVEPTDPAVLEPQFYENARTFKMAYADVFKHSKEQKKYYNIMINGCIKCHESYCSGPLRRIRKFPIE